MNAVEPIADVVTGAIASRAVEPQTGIDAGGHTSETACLNCATPLVGTYCHACGQHSHVHRSLGAFGHDLLHGIFHFEGKIWRTLPLLVAKPGQLTRRYIDGQRASFVGPLPLFLFTVFLMFAVAGWVGGMAMPSDVKVKTGVAEQVKLEEQKLAAKKLLLTKAKPGSAEAVALRKQVTEDEQDLSLLRTVSKDGLFSGSMIRVSDDVPDVIRSPLESARRNPQLLIYKLKDNAYKYSWALIPMSVPFLWLLFPFSRRFRLYDHTVFVTYSLCFMSFLVAVGMLWRATGLQGVSLLMIVPPVHMFLQLRGAYTLGWFGALWRTLFLTVTAFTILLFFGLGLLALGVLD